MLTYIVESRPLRQWNVRPISSSLSPPFSYKQKYFTLCANFLSEYTTVATTTNPAIHALKRRRPKQYAPPEIKYIHSRRELFIVVFNDVIKRLHLSAMGQVRC